MPLVYLGLGSNLGDRAANLWEAVRRLERLPSAHSVRVSPLYETEPVGPIAQGWFLNAALRFRVDLPPHDLLHAAKGIEAAMGRTVGERWGPRLIDIDLLLYDGLQIESEELVLPHPELWNRRFALAPLRDVLPRGKLLGQVERRLRSLGEIPAVRLYLRDAG